MSKCLNTHFIQINNVTLYYENFKNGFCHLYLNSMTSNGPHSLSSGMSMHVAIYFIIVKDSASQFPQIYNLMNKYTLHQGVN